MRPRPSGGDHLDGRQDTKRSRPGRPGSESLRGQHVEPIDRDCRPTAGAQCLDPEGVRTVPQVPCEHHVSGLEARSTEVDGGDHSTIDQHASLATGGSDRSCPGDGCTPERDRCEGAAGLGPVGATAEVPAVRRERPRARPADPARRIRHRGRAVGAGHGPVADRASAVDRANAEPERRSGGHGPLRHARRGRRRPERRPIPVTRASLELVALEPGVRVRERPVDDDRHPRRGDG